MYQATIYLNSKTKTTFKSKKKSKDKVFKKFNKALRV